ncbi:MAG: S8 family serine peptidase, partial [Candidatus Pacearchaeota archaeon]
MKKRVIISLTFIFLIFILLTSNTSESKESNKIDSQVIKEIQEKGKAKVIVVLKEQKDLPSEFKMISSQVLREQTINKINKERVKHRFTSFNGFSASLTKEELAKLELDERVERIEYDEPVHAFLQDSVPLINATPTWQVQVNGINITGEGETICIIDTGINYTHPDLGGCTIKNLTLNGNTEDYVLESSHNYTNNEDTIWKINYTGFSRLA